ncbi:MAG: hypothetical protein JRE12_00775 [Deltaproteobacteria bacterium]|nr:hypothetical protein [Deltaproteobacteria bacterium]
MKIHWKKYVKIFALFFIVIGMFYTCGLHVPFFVKNIHKQIKQGQSVDQAVNILNGSAISPDLCCWQIIEAEPLCSDSEFCIFPTNKIILNDTGPNFRLNVVYMGPGYMHNEFHVNFDSKGIVTTVTDIRKWD